jgi:hypothetical protein
MALLALATPLDEPTDAHVRVQLETEEEVAHEQRMVLEVAFAPAMVPPSSGGKLTPWLNTAGRHGFSLHVAVEHCWRGAHISRKNVGDCHTSRRVSFLKISVSASHVMQRTIRATCIGSRISEGGCCGERYSEKKCSIASWSSAETIRFCCSQPSS